MKLKSQFLIAIALTLPAAAQDEGEFPFEMYAQGVNVVSSARDEAKTREFYGECLGLEEIAPLEIPGSGKMLRFMAGVTELKFILIGEDLPSAPGGLENGTGIRMLTIFVNDGEGAAKRLKAKGYDASSFFDNEGKLQRNGYVRDPGDNEISVVFLPDGVDPKSYRRMRINLTVRDMAKSRKFYGSLGLEELSPSSSGGDDMKYMFQAGPTSIRLVHELPDFPVPSEPVYHDDRFGMHYIQFIVQDVDAEFAKLVEKGAPVAREPFDLGTLARIAMIFDPDGTVIEFAGPRKP
jgi:catechol 2,3-dioxygenase-like lactoylglutathione lyase family enzyme